MRYSIRTLMIATAVVAVVLRLVMSRVHVTDSSIELDFPGRMSYVAAIYDDVGLVITSEEMIRGGAAGNYLYGSHKITQLGLENRRFIPFPQMDRKLSAPR